MSALNDFVTRSAKSYLQSVVFVDDKIYYKDKPTETSPVPLHVSGGIKPQVAELDGEDENNFPDIENPTESVLPDAVPITLSESSSEASKPDYHPRQLMESFAQQGIVCALYEPLKGFGTDKNSVLFHLCERADIVILDWDLHGDGGEGVSRLLSELIQAGQAELPHHVRLCAIYTDEPNLHSVLNTLFIALVNAGCDVDVEGSRLHLIAGASRISIFGKPGSVGRPPDSKDYEVSETELANKIISEFARIHHGILPAFALHGLASVRKNTKRLLDKFRSELDGAFLLHRSLVLTESEAFDELPELLSDEIRAILEDMWPGNTQLQEITRLAVNSLPLSEPPKPWKTLQGQAFDAKLAFRKMLELGKVGLAEATKDCNVFKDVSKDVVKKGFRILGPGILKDFEAMLVSNSESRPEQLSVLFCNRTQYGAVGRKLRFGTVVRHKEKDADSWSFSVCLMPICDSQRLDREQRFPFWKLRQDAKCGLSAKRHGVAVDFGGVTFSLAAGGKIRDSLWVAPFKHSEIGWVESVTKETQFIFETPDHNVEWVAELKPLHAQRIAAYMGAEVSRVGLVESEWLRLFCDR